VVYVACSASNDVAVVSVASGTVTQRIAMGAGLSHLALTGDGKLLVGTNRDDQSVSVASTMPGGEVVRIPVAIAHPTGVVISGDDKYAFVSVAGDGTLPGAVVMIDLAARRIVGSLDVASLATGIDMWKQEP
jgi:DNA-binding beta-propeller fold protein YncE